MRLTRRLVSREVRGKDPSDPSGKAPRTQTLYYTEHACLAQAPIYSVRITSATSVDVTAWTHDQARTRTLRWARIAGWRPLGCNGLNTSAASRDAFNHVHLNMASGHRVQIDCD